MGVNWVWPQKQLNDWDAGKAYKNQTKTIRDLEFGTEKLEGFS